MEKFSSHRVPLQNSFYIALISVILFLILLLILAWNYYVNDLRHALYAPLPITPPKHPRFNSEKKDS